MIARDPSNSGPRASADTHLRLPPEQFYWALIDAPGVGTQGTLPEALRDELGQDIPVPADDLVAVTTPTEGGRLLVCAVRRDDLKAIPETARSLGPESVPPEFGAAVDSTLLNFLVGEFEPRPVRRARVRRHARRMAVLLTAAALVTVGLARRALHEESLARAAGIAATTLAAELAPSQSPATAVLALDQELDRLRRANRADKALTPSPDASLNLARVLDAWPSQVSSKPQSISVSPTGVMASVTLEGDATAFIHALRPPPGWTLDEPRMNSSSGITRVSLQMKPISTPPSGKPSGVQP